MSSEYQKKVLTKNDLKENSKDIVDFFSSLDIIEKIFTKKKDESIVKRFKTFNNKYTVWEKQNKPILYFKTPNFNSENFNEIDLNDINRVLGSFNFYHDPKKPMNCMTSFRIDEVSEVFYHYFKNCISNIYSHLKTTYPDCLILDKCLNIAKYPEIRIGNESTLIIIIFYETKKIIYTFPTSLLEEFNIKKDLFSKFIHFLKLNSSQCSFQPILKKCTIQDKLGKESSLIDRNFNLSNLDNDLKTKILNQNYKEILTHFNGNIIYRIILNEVKKNTDSGNLSLDEEENEILKINNRKDIEDSFKTFIKEINKITENKIKIEEIKKKETLEVIKELSSSSSSEEESEDNNETDIQTEDEENINESLKNKKTFKAINTESEEEEEDDEKEEKIKNVSSKKKTLKKK